MDFWDRLGKAQEDWIPTQPKSVEDFLCEYIVTLVRRKELMFDPLEFYRLTAQIVQSPSEAAYRTAISRAY